MSSCAATALSSSLLVPALYAPNVIKSSERRYSAMRSTAYSAAARPGAGDASRPRVGPGCAGGFGPGADVEVVVTYRVRVARVPFLGSVAGPGVTVGATHHTRVDRYRGVGG